MIKNYDIPNLENIINLYKLREIFKKYNRLINILYEENIDKNTNSEKFKKKEIDDIKIDINKYYDKDEFAFALNKNIKTFIEKNKDNISNIEMLGIITQYNPYFNIRDLDDKERYKNKRDTYIFDYIDFSKITNHFIQTFKILNFEMKWLYK